MYYIHSPDNSLDLADMLKGINDAHKAGYFKRFGLSNYTANDVERVYDLCKQNGYPLPTVYQGNYSAVARRTEQELFPTLRKLNMAFYVYSPLAGGLLTKTKEQLIQGNKDAGRFSKEHRLGSLYGGMYNKPSYHKALDMWQDAANAAGCSKAELAYRWVGFDSMLDPKYGDAVIFRCQQTISGGRNDKLAEEGLLLGRRRRQRLMRSGRWLRRMRRLITSTLQLHRCCVRDVGAL